MYFRDEIIFFRDSGKNASLIKNKINFVVHAELVQDIWKYLFFYFSTLYLRNEHPKGRRCYNEMFLNLNKGSPN